MPCSNYGALAGNRDLARISILASVRWLVLALYLSSPRTLIACPEPRMRTGSSLASRPSRPWAWDPHFCFVGAQFHSVAANLADIVGALWHCFVSPRKTVDITICDLSTSIILFEKRSFEQSMIIEIVAKRISRFRFLYSL